MFTESSLTWRASFTMFSSTIIYLNSSSEFVRIFDPLRRNRSMFLFRLCLLVSYALAGSQAFATLFHVG